MSSSDPKIARRDVLKLGAAGAAVLATGNLATNAQVPPPAPGRTAYNFKTPPMDRVRTGFIGVGARGSGHVAQMLVIDGVEVVAITDPHKPSAEASAKRCVDSGRPAPTLYVDGERDYQRMLARDDIDIVVISTPWEWHVPQAVEAMRAGKHAFIEVPAAITVEGCWELVDTAEETQRHCMMMENVNYGREELLVLNMCRKGLFGDLLHGEAAYIHDLRWQMKEIGRGTGSWRTYHYTQRNGNLYPTHGLGPVAQYMNINRGDRLDFLSSVSCPARSREIWAAANFPEGHERRSLRFACGDLNTTIAQTVNGKTLMIQWDEQLPRPYTRHNFIQGTKGAWGGFPNRIAVEGRTPSFEQWVEGDALQPWYDEFEHPLWKRMGEEAQRNGGHGGMDFIMLWRIVYCLRNGLALDQDVYDAAVWSVVTPLSEKSVANRGMSVDVPDFTRGQWRHMEPFPVVS